jgi:hypothetical protein
MAGGLPEWLMHFWRNLAEERGREIDCHSEWAENKLAPFKTDKRMKNARTIR